MNITEGNINDQISFACYGLEVKEEQGIIKLGPSKANSEVLLVREEGPLEIVATKDTLIINYGGEHLLRIESFEDKGHIVRALNEEGNDLYTISGNECEEEIEQKFGQGKIHFSDEGHAFVLDLQEKEIGLEISLQVEGFDEKRKLKYVEMGSRHKFQVEMRSRSEMNLEEINKVEQELLESNRAGARSASMGVGRSAVAGAVKRSFDIFREHGLQVIRNDVPVIELKVP